MELGAVSYREKRQTQDTLLLGKALACPVMSISTGAIGLKDPKIVKRKKKKIWRKLLSRALPGFVAIHARLAQELSVYPVTKHHLLL